MRATAQSYLISPEAMGRVEPNPARLRDAFSWAYLVAAAARRCATCGSCGSEPILRTSNWRHLQSRRSENYERERRAVVREAVRRGCAS
jgi:hypothetical protein